MDTRLLRAADRQMTNAGHNQYTPNLHLHQYFRR